MNSGLKKIGLALSGGGTKGIARAGVFRKYLGNSSFFLR